MHPIIDEIFGKTFDCACGRTHTIQPESIVYADDAVEQLGALARDAAAGGTVCVLMDTRTRQAAGEAVTESLRANGIHVHELLVPDPPDGRDPVCDDRTKDALAARLRPARLFVAVGSGVISDLGKWLAFERDAPCMTFATAASMNGYASANIAPAIRGVKTVQRVRPPQTVLTCPGILRQAPYELTAAGLGDALAKSVSSADWRLNHLLFGDYYCPRSVELIADIEPLYLDAPEAIPKGDPLAIEALFEALLLTGAAMTMAETSSPASGGEHLISHALDMMAARDGTGHDLHGRQVGVGTILTAEVYRRVLEVESPDPVAPEETIDRAFWGPLAAPVAEQYAEKLPRLREARERLMDAATWDRLRDELQPMLHPPEVIRRCLSAAAAAFRAEDIGCDESRLLAALIHGREMRARFTVLDLAYLLGVLPDAADEIIAEWA